MSVALGQFYFGDLHRKWVSFQSALTTISGSWGLNVVLQARQVYRRRTTQRVTRLPWMGRSR